MSELAGKLNEVWVHTAQMTGSTGHKINGVNDAGYNKLCEILEITQFGDDYKRRMGGIKDSDVSLSGHYDPEDTTGQVLLEPGDTVYIGIYPQGTTVAGTQIPVIIESFDWKADISKQSFSAKLSGNGAPVALPARV